MKILVCVKQVIESGSQIKVDSTGKKIQISDATRYEVNKYDEYAIEEAIQIKEQNPGTQIDVITVGPNLADNALRRALGMGADEGIHIIDDTQTHRAPATIAEWICAVACDNAYDLILTGIMSDDQMNAQTGPMIAQILGMPCATATISEKILPDKKTIAIEREIEGGARDQFEIPLPCVLTIQTGINSPRYPSLSKVLRAKKKSFNVIQSQDLQRTQAIPQLEKISLPRKTAQGLILEGSPREKAEKLAAILTSKVVV